MRNARVLRASSARSVCVFCATRPVASDAAHATLSSTAVTHGQTRRINSSSKDSQYAAEGQLYREDRPLAVGRKTPMTAAERMREHLLATTAFNAPPPLRTQQQSFGGSPARRSQPFHPPTGDRHSRTAAARPKYRTSMDEKPPVIASPQWGSMGNLRRKNEFRAAEVGTPLESRVAQRKPPPRRLLDQAELDRLLSGASKSTRRERPPHFAKPSEGRAQHKCFHCGRTDHTSVNCPTKPVLRQQPSTQVGPTLGSTLEAANRWVSTKGAKKEATQEEALFEERRRWERKEAEKRRARFVMDQASASSRTRPDEPARRVFNAAQRRPRRQFNRDGGEEEDFEDTRLERKRKRTEAKKRAQLEKAEPTPVYLPEYISVANLASLLKLRVNDFVRKLEELGFEDVQNDHILNAEHAGLIAQEYNFEPIVEAEGEDGDVYPAEPVTPEAYAELPPRPPVVTIMGHVDHGKTTILDYMRSTSVAAGEFGGITQHIGAFSVPLSSGKAITFLDTPGHAAFETMRARGANVTDIVVLVVAADDSVMPQTVEAIKHAQAAHVPIIVAINKIDKPQADPERVKSDLARHGVEVEDFGGDVQAVLVSGKTGMGISDLEEAISTLSEILDHRADPKAKIEGWVLESSTKKSGKVATVLVRSGTLKQGDILVAGTTWTRVRALHNEAGVAVNNVGPGMPVEVHGWRDQPLAGDEVLQAEDEQHAAEVAQLRTEKLERQQMAKDVQAINEARRLEAERRDAEEAAAKDAETGSVDTPEKASGPEIVNFIVKADVSGSVEAVVDSISAIGNNEVGIRVLRSGVGAPSEFDVQHAATAGGCIVNFNTAIPSNIAALAEEKGVTILDENIIYQVVDKVKGLLSEKLPPKITQRVTGEAEVAAIFEIGLGGKKKMKVAGSKVRNGVVMKGSRVRVLRRDAVVFDGTLSSLKNVKKDVNEMRKDTECGIAFQGWEDFVAGDKIQCYEEISEARNL